MNTSDPLAGERLTRRELLAIYAQIGVATAIGLPRTASAGAPEPARAASVRPSAAAVVPPTARPPAEPNRDHVPFEVTYRRLSRDEYVEMRMTRADSRSRVRVRGLSPQTVMRIHRAGGRWMRDLDESNPLPEIPAGEWAILMRWKREKVASFLADYAQYAAKRETYDEPRWWTRDDVEGQPT